MSRQPVRRPLKIAVYAICLNEEAFVDRFVDAVADADLIVIADTGSTDGTVAAFERRGSSRTRSRFGPGGSTRRAMQPSPSCPTMSISASRSTWTS